MHYQHELSANPYHDVVERAKDPRVRADLLVIARAKLKSAQRNLTRLRRTNGRHVASDPRHEAESAVTLSLLAVRLHELSCQLVRGG